MLLSGSDPKLRKDVNEVYVWHGTPGVLSVKQARNGVDTYDLHLSLYSSTELFYVCVCTHVLVHLLCIYLLLAQFVRPIVENGLKPGGRALYGAGTGVPRVS